MGLTFWVNGDKVSLADHEVNPRMTLLECECTALLPSAPPFLAQALRLLGSA